MSTQGLFALNVFSLSVVFLIQSCGRSAQSDSSISNETVSDIDLYVPPTRPLEDCRVNRAESQYPVAQKYAEQMLGMVLDKNKDVFVAGSVYDPEFFCITVVDDGIAVKADARSRSITIGYHIFGFSQNDAQFAALVSHELAHIAQQHDGDEIPAAISQEAKQRIRGLQVNRQKKIDKMSQTMMTAHHELTPYVRTLEKIDADDFRFFSETFFNIFEKRTDSRSIEDKFRDLRDIIRRNSRLAGNHESQVAINLVNDLAVKLQQHSSESLEIEKFSAEITSILAESLGEEAAHNWREEMADTIGYRYYLKSGFKADQFSQQIRQYLMRDGGSPLVDQCESQIASGLVPNRGKNPHPMECWRLWNLKRQATLSPLVYGPLVKNNSIVTLEMSPTFQEVKDSISPY